jgi:hypothetical protein
LLSFEFPPAIREPSIGVPLRVARTARSPEVPGSRDVDVLIVIAACLASSRGGRWEKSASMSHPPFKNTGTETGTGVALSRFSDL